jgi:hypothetical protein
MKEPREGDQHTADYFAFYQDELKADGTKADPIRVRHANNDLWDAKTDGLIGNGSKVEVKFVVKDYGPGKHKGVYIRAIRVSNKDFVKYVPQDFAPASPDDDFFAEGAPEPEIARLPEGMEPLDDLNDEFPE